MRSSVTRSVRTAGNVLLLHETRATQSRRPRFVCATCRAAAAAQRPNTQHISQRAFTTSSPRQQGQEPPQPPQTHYDFFPQTFPDGPPPKAAFTPDLRQLRREFLQLQAKAHPDLAPQDQKRHAEALSMRINEAYKTLQDPLKRAQYLLHERGIDVEDETAKLEDKELLMEVMEAREAVEEVEDEAGLVGIREENNERIAASVKELEVTFQRGDLQAAAREAIKLRYWTNIEESIHGWEKGQGGGILHH